MKKIIEAISILLVIVIYSCSTQPKITTVPSELDSAATLFASEYPNSSFVSDAGLEII
jgi:hypothetical protein